MKKVSTGSKCFYNVIALSGYLSENAMTIDAYFEERKMAPTKTSVPIDADSLLMIDDDLYHQVTRYTKSPLPSTGAVAISLVDHINANYSSVDDFATEKSENILFFADKKIVHLMWVNGEVFEPLPTKSMLVKMSLSEHIFLKCNGFEARFARVCGVTQQQMHRWCGKGHLWVGDVYSHKVALKSYASLHSVRSNVVELKDHIKEVFGIGEMGMKAFAAYHGLILQNVKRYVLCHSLFVTGGIYTNQSKFKQKKVKLDYSLARKESIPAPTKTAGAV
jgi:hypothetical protein